MIDVDKEIKSGKVVMVVLDRTGDTQVVCDPVNKTQVVDFLQQFSKYMDEGYVAFEVVNEETKKTIDKKAWGKMDDGKRKEFLFDNPKEIRLIPLIVGG